MKTEPRPVPIPAVTSAEWEALRRSRPEDNDGHTGLGQMTSAVRLAWLETAVEFVARHARHQAPLPLLGSQT